MERIVVINIVRSLAVLMVLVHHLGLFAIGKSSPTYFLHWIWYKCWVNGEYGVPVFFVISGFLISKLIASGRGGLFKPDFRDFYTRRIGRIYPLLILVSLLGFVFICFVPPGVFPVNNFFQPNDLHTQPLFWLSIATFWFNWYRVPMAHSPGAHWGVLWSLSVEEQFYFFYPFILSRLGGEKKLYAFLFVFIVLGPISQWIGYSHFRFHNNIEYNSFTGFGLIATGCLLYILSEKYKEHLQHHPKTCFYLCLLGGALVTKVYFHQPYLADYWGNIFDYSLIGWGMAVFLMGALHVGFFNSKLWWLMEWNGKMSYGIYLLQVTVMCLLYPIASLLNEYLAFLLVATAVLVLSLLSFYGYEKPLNLWIRRSLTRRPAAGR